MQTTAIIDGHQFEVIFDYTPEVKPESDEPFEEEDLRINHIFLGAYDLNSLLVEEAPDLHDKIVAQVMTRFKEGDL